VKTPHLCATGIFEVTGQGTFPCKGNMFAV